MSWTRFLKQALKDLRAYTYFVLLLLVFRIVLITVFISRKDPSSGIIDILSALANGFRFDSRVAFYFILPTLLLSIAGGFVQIDRIVDRIRLVVAIIFTTLTLFICGATIPYFREYNDQFNQWVYGLLYDDLNAILKTAWAQVPVVRMGLGLVCLIVILSFLLKKFLNRTPRWPDKFTRIPAWGKTLGTVFLICLFVVAARGSAGPRPVELKDAAVTQDPFLNKTVLNPYEALRYIYHDFKELRNSEGIDVYLPDGNIRSAVQSFFHDTGHVNQIDDCMLHAAAGNGTKPPKHIFLIVMEGYNAWTMMDRYASLQAGPRLKAIAENGIWVKRFLSASKGTTGSLTTIISGLPDNRIMINYQPSALHPYPTSIAPIFKRLGYKTRFFYGGYLSWQRIGEFCRNQGFDEVYGAPHMGNWEHANEWGVDDADLFAFIEKTAHDDIPSFNMIMTTSNHPPFDIDVYGAGYPVKKMPADLAGIYDGAYTMNEFGHMWYGDHCVGQFAHWIEKHLTAPLFAMTGDHYSRRFLNINPTVFERNAVPLVLYGPAVLKDKHLPENAVGSHIDIGPTLIELAAPKGFQYYSMGKNLLADDPDPVAIGARFAVVTPDVIFEDIGNPLPESYPENIGSGKSPRSVDTNALLKRANDYYAIGWWRVMQGPNLPGETAGRKK